MKEYDMNGSGKLGRVEVKNMLSDLSDGLDISDDELNFVFKIADTNGDKKICPVEMGGLLTCWGNYQKSRKEIEDHFRKHDPDGTDRLDYEQLRELLMDLSGGEFVSAKRSRIISGSTIQ